MSKYPVEMKSHLEAATASLRAAAETLEGGQYESAVSRAAEAAFHTGSLLLLHKEIEPGKHGDLITLIQEMFVNRRRFTKEQGGNLSWLFARQNAEARGKAAPISSEEAHKAVEIAQNFFEAAKVILSSRS